MRIYQLRSMSGNGEAALEAAELVAGAQTRPVDPAASRLRRACEGDHNAFAELVREHQRMVFGLAVHAVHDRAAAEELAQEVFIRLYRSLPSIESPRHLIFWLRRVTSQRCVDHVRRERTRALVLARSPSDRESLPRVRDPLLGRALRRLLESLPARARMIVVLRYQEDLEPAEISSLLNLPINTVKSRLQRSLAFLRSNLGVPADDSRDRVTDPRDRTHES